MNNNTSIKQNKLLRFLIALILVISMSAQILAPHITVYAGGVDSNSISNGSDTEETNPQPSSGKKYLCIYSDNGTSRKNAFWVGYVANTSGEIIGEPKIIFPEKFTSAQQAMVLTSDQHMLKCHLDPSRVVTQYIHGPFPGLVKPKQGNVELTNNFQTGAIDHKKLIKDLVGESEAVEIMNNPDQYYLILEVSNVVTHSSPSNPKVTKVFLGSPLNHIDITRTLPDGVTDFHVDYAKVNIYSNDDIEDYVDYWVNRYYNGRKILDSNDEMDIEEAEDRISYSVNYAHKYDYLDPRKALKVVWDGTPKQYSATVLGWSMEGADWWDKSQGYIWSYWLPFYSYHNKEGWAGLPATVPGKAGLIKNALYNPDIADPGKGWGMAAIKISQMGSSSSIDTYDIPNHPPTPSYCEYPTPGLKSGPCKIVKHYWIENSDGSYTKFGTYTRDLTSNNIHITDEKNKVGYELIGWWSTDNYNASLDDPTPRAPVETRRTSATSAGYQQGTTEQTVILNQDTGEKTLVLVFIKSEGTTTLAVDGDYRIWQSQIAQRNSFDTVTTLKALTNQVFKWESSGHKTSCSGHLTCGKSEHSHSSSCKDANGNTNCGKSEHSHSSSCYSYCKNWGWKDQSVSFAIHNANGKNCNTYASVLSIKNEEVIYRSPNYSNPNYKIPYTNSAELLSGKRSYTSGSVFTISSGYFHYNFIIFRGKDRLTLADWKNTSGTKDFLTGISNTTYNFKSANKPTGTRAAESYVDKFVAKFTDGPTNGSDDHTTTYSPSSPVGTGCGNSRTYSLKTPSSSPEGTAKVAVDVYWASGEESDLEMQQGAGINDIPQNEVNAELEAGSISFVPYIMMRFDTRTTDNDRAAVLSQRSGSDGLVETKFYDWIDYVIDKGDTRKYAIGVTSTQWSTHKQAASEIAKFFGGSAPSGDYIANGFADQSILPGGAVFSIGIPEQYVRTVTVKTMQAYLPKDGSGYEQIDKTGGTITGLSTDKQPLLDAHKKLVEDAMEEWSKTEIHEYLATNPSVITSATSSTLIKDNGIELFGDGMAVDVLKDSSGATLENHTNQDTKYYFGGDYSKSTLNTCYAKTVAGSNLSDESYKESTKTQYYTFFTNVYGQVLCQVKDSEDSAKLSSDFKKLKPGGDIKLVANSGSCDIASSVDRSSALYEVAVMTDVVRSLRYATASARGNDTTIPDAYWGSNWYNEAFDGITYIYQRTDFKVGLWDPALRETVLDPAVTPYQASKDDFFTLFHAMVLNSWKETDDFSTEPFKNNNGKEYMLEYEFTKLYGSKIFYIPNVTTQDLN